MQKEFDMSRSAWVTRYDDYQVIKKWINSPDGTHMMIPLHCGQLALADFFYRDKLERHDWHANWDARTKSFHIITYAPRKDDTPYVIYLDRFIMGATQDTVVKHIENDNFDCRTSKMVLVHNFEKDYAMYKKKSMYRHR